MKTNKYNTIFGRTETEIEKTITRALNKIGVPIDYSKIFAVDEEGICINLTYDYVEQPKVDGEEVSDFLDDEEKMADFNIQTKEDFLRSYSYLTEQEYDNTRRRKANGN